MHLLELHILLVLRKDAYLSSCILPFTFAFDLSAHFCTNHLAYSNDLVNCALGVSILHRTCAPSKYFVCTFLEMIISTNASTVSVTGLKI